MSSRKKPVDVFEGLQVVHKGVWCHYSREVGTTKRHSEFLIPWSDLTDDEFLRQLDRVVRRRLIEAWSGTAIEVPLPFE